MKRNKELFFAIAARIDAKPELYRQAHFGKDLKCGTVHCIAGWAAVLSGAEPDGPPYNPWKVVKVDGGRRVDLVKFAAKQLGLSLAGGYKSDAWSLFSPNWKKAPRDKSVSEALRRIGNGGQIRRGPGAVNPNVR